MAKLAWAKGSDVKNKAPQLAARLERRGHLKWMKAKHPLLDHFQSPCHQQKLWPVQWQSPGNEVVPLFGLTARLTTVAAPHRFNARMSLIRTARWKPLYRRLAEARASTRVHLARAAIEAPMLVAEHGGDTMLQRIGIMRALYPGGTAPTPPKRRAKKYRVVS